METILTTERLILRPWLETDAESLYKYAKDPDIGLPAGWPPHKSVEESLDIIKNVLRGKESYAICEKENDEAIGAIALKLNGNTDMTERDDECELGYWLGKPFWGRGYMPEAAMELLRHGNIKSKRAQEKIGFRYHHTCDEVPVTLLNEVRVGHTNYMTLEMWKDRR